MNAANKPTYQNSREFVILVKGVVIATKTTLTFKGRPAFSFYENLEYRGKYPYIRIICTRPTLHGLNDEYRLGMYRCHAFQTLNLRKQGCMSKNTGTWIS